MLTWRLAIRTVNRQCGSTGIAPLLSSTNHLQSVSFSSLFSEDDQKVTKKKKNKKKQKKEKTQSEKSKITDILIKCADAPIESPPPASDEEMERRYQIGRNYVIGKFKEHNERNHDLACKIKMKQFAIKMLPRGTMWKEEALKISTGDDGGPPLWRRVAVDTPPIPGFNAADWIQDE